jgi:hypothetical protein
VPRQHLRSNALTQRASGRPQRLVRAWLAHDLTTTRNHSTTIVRSIGAYRGLTLELQLHWFHGEPKEPELSVVLEHDGQRRTLASIKADTDAGAISSLDYHMRTLEEQLAARQRQQQELEQRQTELAASVARPWEGAATYQRATRELQRLNAELGGADAPASSDAADAEMGGVLAEVLALTTAPAEPIAPSADATGAMGTAPDGHVVVAQTVAVAPLEAAAMLPVSPVDTHPTPPLQPAPPPEHPHPIPPCHIPVVTFGDHAWMTARPVRRKPAAAPVPAEQLRLFE